MSLLKINGVAMPTPTSLIPSIQDISQAERNANGTMIIERIATKMKLEVSFKILSAEDTSKILTAISPVFFNVEYLHPQTNKLTISTFYVGDRSIPMMDFKNGIPRYKDLKFSLIER